MFFRFMKKLAVISFSMFAFQFFLVAFAPSSYALPVNISNSSVQVYGFCANRAKYQAGMLDYSPYGVTFTNSISKTNLSTGYNQFSFNSLSCSDPWGISSIVVPMDDNYGWETDGKWLNIDIVSNNSYLPFFNGAKLYAIDSSNQSLIPGFIDRRTYDVQLQYNSYTWLSGRDQPGSFYSMDFDEIEVLPDQPSVMYHITYSIPYISDNFTSNGVSNIRFGTSQYLLDPPTNGSHFVDFASTESPFFYLNDYTYNSNIKFWIKLDVSDEPLYDDDNSWTDQWSADYQATLDYINSNSDNAVNSANSLNIGFSVPWIFQPWFDMFTNSSCVSIPTISSWLRSTENQVCTPWSAEIRNVTTPIFTILSSMLLFGFVIRWLDHRGRDETYHEKGN